MSENSLKEINDIIVIGAGPAGLTAAYELVKHHQRPVVVEKNCRVGGLARTESYNGYHFDMGGHRFFTKAPAVTKMWREVLGKDFIRRPRLSRIYYKNKFFSYPLEPFNALAGLGVIESLLIGLSYLRWQIFPYRQEETFEQWVTNRFGKRLFLTFFKAYTEKVWGISCSELKAEWAAQRIKDLSLKTALLAMFFKPRKTIKTLIEEFEYPRLGPGMMWNAVKQQIEERGAAVHMEMDVTSIARNGASIKSVTMSQNGRSATLEGSHFISSMPLSEFIKKLEPPPPEAVLQAADKIHYRDFLTVCLIVNKGELFPDNWIYVHDPGVKVGRIQNFKNWSADMVPDAATTSLGLEYFCTEGDRLWNMADADLIELGKREVESIGLACYGDIGDGCVRRVPKAYPIYDSDYAAYLATVRKFVDGFVNFQTIGRNGLHRYNNQDHSMLTGMLAVRNIVFDEKHDLWSVNTDREYHEEVAEETGLEGLDVTEVLRDAVARAFPRLDRTAFGVALGTLSGAIIFLATLMLVVKGGDVVGPNLALLNQFFPGYRVSLSGSILGLVYGFASGFGAGWGFAFLRNVTMFAYMAFQRRSAERQLMRNLLEYF